MKNVACYCRVSTEEQVKFGFSIEAQRDALIKYCKENNYKYDIYVDEGISASSMKKRLELQKMLDNCKNYDMIIFTKLDRLSRNVLDANNINKILIENKCTMKAIDEDDIDTSTADGTFIFNLKVSLAQREIEKTSERINFVFKDKREKGLVTSGAKKYGYDIIDKKFVVNQEEANNLNNLYNFFIETGGNYQDTYKYFISHFKGGKDTLYKYLRDTAYIGKYKLYKKDEYIDNYCPPIMNESLFNSVQNLLIKKEKTSKRTISQSLFSGLLFCSECGLKLHKKQDNRVKHILIRYGCNNASRFKPNSLEKKCNNKTLIREEIIEDYLLENIKKLAQKYIAENQIIKQKKDTSFDADIKKIENKITKIKDLYLEDLISKEDYTKDYTFFTNELQKLKTKKKPQFKDTTNLEKTINMDLNKIYSSLSLEEKRHFWLEIIDKITIQDGKIIGVTFL